MLSLGAVDRDCKCFIQTTSNLNVNGNKIFWNTTCIQIHRIYYDPYLHSALLTNISASNTRSILQVITLYRSFLYLIQHFLVKNFHPSFVVLSPSFNTVLSSILLCVTSISSFILLSTLVFFPLICSLIPCFPILSFFHSFLSLTPSSLPFLLFLFSAFFSLLRLPSPFFVFSFLLSYHLFLSL